MPLDVAIPLGLLGVYVTIAGLLLASWPRIAARIRASSGEHRRLDPSPLQLIAIPPEHVGATEDWHPAQEYVEPPASADVFASEGAKLIAWIHESAAADRAALDAALTPALAEFRRGPGTLIAEHWHRTGSRDCLTCAGPAVTRLTEFWADTPTGALPLVELPTEHRKRLLVAALLES